MEHPRFISYDYPEEKAAIQEMLEGLTRNLASLDLDLIASDHLYVPKFTRVDDGVRVEAEAGRQIERDFFGSIDRFDSQFKDVRIDVFEHTALVTSIFECEGEVGGETNAVKFHLTFLLVNVGGEWKIIYEGLFGMPAE